MWRSLSTGSLLIVSAILLVKPDQPGINAASSINSQVILEIRQYTNAVQRAVDFFGKHSNTVTLDGVFALRISQGHFTALKNAFHEPGTSQIPVDLIRSLLSISQKIDSVILVGIEASKHIRKPLKVVKYFQKMGFVIESNVPTWPLKHKANMLLSTPVSERVQGTFRSVDSDFCMSEMIGTGPSHTNCSLNSKCRNFMLEPYGARASGYTVTHQLLFAQLSVMRGCQDTYETALRHVGKKHGGDAKKVSTIRRLFGVGCANIYLEMKKTMAGDTSKLEALARDIFLEQGSLCSMYGYPAVLPDEWLSKVLPWQTGIGCIDDGRGFASGTADQLSRSRRDESSEIRQDATDTAHSEDTHPGASRSHATGRKLLYDVEMADGCSQHSTGLFISYLTAKIRYKTELELGLHSVDLSEPELKTSHHGRKTIAQEVQSLVSSGAAHVHSAANSLLEKLKSLNEYLNM